MGKRSLSAFGLTSVDVTRKKTSNRKTMSVIDDILNDGLTFERRLIAIVFCFIYRQVREEDP